MQRFIPAEERGWDELLYLLKGTYDLNYYQNCSECGKKVKKSLSTRTHVCPHCGFVEDRDVNAAINILKLALCTAGHTGTYAWGDLLFGERLE